MTNSVTLHRVLKAPPEKVYRAFTDPHAMAFWLPPYGFLCTVHHLDARVGGSHRMSFTNFSTGSSHSFGGDYLELVPGDPEAESYLSALGHAHAHPAANAPAA